MDFFSSSPVAPSPSSSAPYDGTPVVALPPPSSSSAMLDLSLASGKAFMASSATSSCETLSPSFTSVPSVSLKVSTAPVSSADMIQTLSGAPFRDTCSSSPSLGSTPPHNPPQPDIPSVTAGLNSSTLLQDLPSSVLPVKDPLPLPLEMSSSEVGAMSAETSSCSPVDALERSLSSVLPSTCAPTDKNPSTPQISMSRTSSRSEFPPAAPSESPGELSALSAPSESKPEMLTSSETRTLMDVPETDPSALSVPPPVGASTGLLPEHERSSLETSTSFPSGTSGITSSYPALISKLPTTFPSRSVCKLPDQSSVSTSNPSPVKPKLEPPRLTDPAFAHSMSTSCLALLSSVDSAPSRASLRALQMAQNCVASLKFPLPSSSLLLNESSPCGVMPESRVSSLLLAAPSSDLSSNDVAASTTLALPIVSHSSASPFPAPLNSSPSCYSAGGDSGSREAMDCSLSLSSHFTNTGSNSASSMSSFSHSLLEIRSIKEEQSASSDPPIAPSSDTFPRRAVRGGQKGEGWPYAPQGWPERDDRWLWRVGKRVHVNGYFRDRFLGLPKGLCKGRTITEFASKKSIVEYLRVNFPDLCVENFFKSFQWRVPYVHYRNSYSAGVLKGNAVKRRRSAEEDTNAQNLSKRSKKECRAGNPNCGLETGQSVLLGDHVGLPCDICCTETGFCRECKCILCCKTIVPDAGECNFVRCLQRPSGDAICGHAAHVECALQSKMAGVVKKRGLDMEYLCRRCDNKTDLRELVTLLLEAIGNTELKTQAEKSLELALELMKGTERGGTGARVLETLVQTALRKVQGGVDIREVFMELKDQGAAAEAARQQNLVRSSSLAEDVSQQPEASLDQWLQEGSPSSHPSPATPSSFTSPHMRSNPSVTSGQQNGTQYVDGSVGKHAVAEGHVGGPQSSPEVYSNPDYKISHLGSKPLIQNTGQVRGSHRVRAVSSNVNNNSHDAISDSYTARAWGNHVGEPSLRDGNSSQLVGHNSNSGMKKQKDQRNPSSGGRMHREDTIFTEICRSCGTVRRHTSNALEVTSSHRILKIEDGRKKILQSPFTPREEEPGDSDNYKHVAESDPGVDQRSRPASTFSANASAHKAIGTSLHLLDVQCERDVQDALQKLRQSQEAEYEHAKEHLNAQREFTMRQYELLETTRMEFSEQPLSSSLEAFDELLLKTANQFTKTIEERETFKIMLKVAGGFGSFSKDHLSKFYRWPPEK